MNRLKINNTPIFVTVLSACLGLVVTGAPTVSVHRKAQSVLSEIAAATSTNLSYSQSSNQALGLTAIASEPRHPLAYSEAVWPAFLYRNTNTQSACNQILVVTHLARASLDAAAAA